MSWLLCCQRLASSFLLVLLAVCGLLSGEAAAQTCAPNTSSVYNIKICSPGASSTSPVQVQATVYSAQSPVVHVKIYVDNVEVYGTDASGNSFAVDQSIAMPLGSRFLAVQSWNAAGEVAKAQMFVNVTSGSTACPKSSVDMTVTICAPENGATVASPVRILASSYSTQAVLHTKVYVDNQEAYAVDADSIDTSLPISTGSHWVVVQSWDAGGRVFSRGHTITVGSPDGCSAGTANNTVTICQPTEGATVSSPFRLLAKTKSALPVTYMRVYVDGGPIAFEGPVSQIDTNISLGSGPHNLVVVAWNSAGEAFTSSRNLTVSGDCALPSTNLTVSVCTPAAGASVKNPVRVTARARSDSAAITAFRIYVNDQEVFTQQTGTGGSLDKEVIVAPGDHTLVVVAWNAAGQALTSSPRSFTVTPGIEKVKHIVILYQENRSFDQYFGRLNVYRQKNGIPGSVDGLPTNASNPSFDGSTQVAAYKLNTVCHENVSPAWNETHVQANRNFPASDTYPMDGFVYTAATFAREESAKGNVYADLDGIRAMGYYDETHLPYYYFMASQFATSDRWYSPAPTRSTPNRLYGFSGTSAGHAYDPTQTLNNKTIFDLMEAAGVSWKVYYTDVDSFGTPVTFGNYFTNFLLKYGSKVVPLSQYYTDAAAGTLPQVAWVESGYVSAKDEHPGNNIQVGALHVKTIVDALMQGPAWKDSVFLMTFDEAGGLYDHVPPVAAVSPDGIPPIDLKPGDVGGDFTRTGFRLPLLVISPFAKKHFVSHTPADFTATLKFIQKRHALPSLTNRDAAQMDMTEFFDFVNPPWATPPANIPAQPTNAPCYYDRLP